MKIHCLELLALVAFYPSVTAFVGQPAASKTASSSFASWGQAETGAKRATPLTRSEMSSTSADTNGRQEKLKTLENRVADLEKLPRASKIQSSSTQNQKLDLLERRLNEIERDARTGRNTARYGTPYQDLRNFQDATRPSYGLSRYTGRNTAGYGGSSQYGGYYGNSQLAYGGGRNSYYGNSQLARPRGGSRSSSYYGNNSLRLADRIRHTSPGVSVQGSSLETWTFTNPYVDHVGVLLGTDGRPLEADVELWQGPDNTPFKLRVSSEDGFMRPVRALIETPRDTSNTVAVRNIAALAFPLVAHVGADEGSRMHSSSYIYSSGETVQGDSLRTFPFASNVESVQVMLTTAGGPLSARIELMQGPSNNKQVIDVYSENGDDRPVCVELDTPGSENVVRVVNKGPLEFPLYASVEPGMVGPYNDYYGSSYGSGGYAGMGAIRGRGDRGGFMSSPYQW